MPIKFSKLFFKRIVVVQSSYWVWHRIPDLPLQKALPYCRLGCAILFPACVTRVPFEQLCYMPFYELTTYTYQTW